MSQFRLGPSTTNSGRPSTITLIIHPMIQLGTISGAHLARLWASISVTHSARPSTLANLLTPRAFAVSSRVKMSVLTHRWKLMTTRRDRLTSRQPATMRHSGLMTVSQPCIRCMCTPETSSGWIPRNHRTTCGSTSSNSLGNGG